MVKFRTVSVCVDLAELVPVLTFTILPDVNALQTYVSCKVYSYQFHTW